MKHDTMTQMLATADIDLAAGMTDAFATKYGKLHHRLNRGIYKGEGVAESLDLKYDYDISDPLRFDFQPIDDSASKVKRAILRDPHFGNDKNLFRESFEAPTLKLSLPNTNLKFIAISSGSDLASLRLSISIEAYLFLTSTSKEYSIRVISVDINIEEQNLLVETLGDSGCIIDKLIEHILEHVLKDRLSRFIQTIDLPQPQDFITVFDTELRKAEILDNHLYLGLQAVRPRLNEQKSSNLDDIFLPEDLFERTEGLAPITDQKEREMSAVLNMEHLVPRVLNTMKSVDLSSLTGDLPEGDIFVALSERAFQLLADKNLNIDERKEKKEDKSSWYYFYRYWMKVWSPVVSLGQSALNFRAELAGGATGGAGLKGCSSWIKVEIGADARAEPFCHGRAGFYVRGKALDSRSEFCLVDYRIVIVIPIYGVDSSTADTGA